MLRNPHFYIALTKAIAIPDEKIVSGPAYLVFEDVPLPLALPFGFFPNSNKRSSGFIIPDFRDEQTRGFGLENGGWYFPLNDYVDVTLLGSVYSRGTWGVTAASQYFVKYKYRGSFRANFVYNRRSKMIRLTWNQRISKSPGGIHRMQRPIPRVVFQPKLTFPLPHTRKTRATISTIFLQIKRLQAFHLARTGPGDLFILPQTFVVITAPKTGQLI